jgi:hypothetical protein
VFDKEFFGMTDFEIKLEDLLNVRKILIKKVNNMLTDNNKDTQKNN